MRFILTALFISGIALPVSAQSASEIAMAKSILAPLQARSFEAGREFCGIIGVTETGQLIASRPRRGRVDSCRPRTPRRAEDLIASFHTHGSFDPEADSEIPSVDDVYADMDEGLDGWVSTPGGRLWFIDGQSGTIRQICGIGCLPQDPAFVRGHMGFVPQRLTLGQLEAFFDAD